MDKEPQTLNKALDELSDALYELYKAIGLIALLDRLNRFLIDMTNAIRRLVEPQ